MKELFSFRGRSSRPAFWKIYLLVNLLIAAIWSVGLFAIIEIGPWGGAVFALSLPLFVMWVATLIRRAHDRNRGWLWFVSWFVAPTVVVLIGGVISKDDAPALSLVFSLGAIIAFGMVVWAQVEILFLSGTKGPNRFGPDPLAS